MFAPVEYQPSPQVASPTPETLTPDALPAPEPTPQAEAIFPPPVEP
jgi:hypothetical protein